MKIVFITIVSWGAFFILPHIARAQVVINEIAAFETTDHEWVEIYNTGGSAVDMNGWKFWENATNHGLTVQQGDFNISVGAYAIIAQKADVFLADHPGFSGTVLDSSWGTLKESGEEIGLKNNAGNFIEQFTYLESPSTSLERAHATSADYSASNWWPHPSGSTPGQPNSSAGAAAPPPAATPTPTPATDTTTPPATIPPPDPTPVVPRYSRQVVINEFYADPGSGQNEWVELYNTGSLPAKLDGWKVMEGSGVKKTISGELVAGGFLVVEPAGSLNNDGDHILLLDDGNVVINEVSYGDWNDGQTADNAPIGEKGQSVARRRDGIVSASSAADFAVTANATPGAPNTIATPVPTPQPTPTPSPTPLPTATLTPLPTPTPKTTPSPASTIAGTSSGSGSGPNTSPGTNIRVMPSPKAKTAASASPSPKPTPRGTVRGSQRTTPIVDVQTAAANAARTVIGTVVALPGQIGKQIFYLADETGGLQIYQHQSNFPPLAFGDEVEVNGTVSRNLGEPRLKAKDASAIQIIASSKTPLATERRISELTATSSGMLVRISGEVTGGSNRSFMFDDGSGELEVTLPNGAETIPGTGYRGTAQGILVVRNGQIQLRLREPADLDIHEPLAAADPTQKSTPKTPLARYALATVVAGGILGATGWRAFRRRQETTLPPPS